MTHHLTYNLSSDHLTHNVREIDEGDESPPSPLMMSGGDQRPKKNVKWLIGQTSDDQTPTEHDESALSPTATSFRPTSRSDRQEHSQDNATHEELRNRIYEIFTDQPPNAVAQSQAIDSNQRSFAEQRSRPRPKSALRSGTSTPLAPASPPEPIDGIVDLDDKRRSATRAKQEADELSRNLAETGGEGEHKGWRSLFHLPSRSRASSPEKRSLPLYHDGPDLLTSGQTTPAAVDDYDHVPRPSRYRLAGLSAQRLLEKVPYHSPSRRSSFEEHDSLPASPREGPSRPRLLRRNRHSLTSIPTLLSSSAQLGSIAGPSISETITENARPRRPGLPRSQSDSGDVSGFYGFGVGRSSSSNLLDTMYHMAVTPSKKKKPKGIDIRITQHVQETRLRQRYLLRLCRALMEYGAPTHRLEDYMRMSARVLETEAQFLYFPGCMIIAFDDSQTHTTEVKLIKVNQGVDLGKLSDTHEVYKHVVHDTIGVGEATERLDAIIKKHKKFRVWFLVLVHGIASASVAPFAFQGRLIDLPIAFFLGCLLGFLRLVVASKSDLYSNIFEVTSVVLTSFLSRAFGSIHNSDIFCFSALAQSSIALILPGYIVLCGSLELQSRSIVAGSVRLVYAIIYSLFIGFGLTIGTAVYGLLDENASSAAQCSKPMPQYWFFFFVPVFALCLMIINQAKWRQTPVMMIIACAGYFVSYFSSKRFLQNAPVSSALAAVAISVLANLYSRIGLTVDHLIDKFSTKARTALTRVVSNKESQKSHTEDLEKQVNTQGDSARNASSASVASSTVVGDLDSNSVTANEHAGQREAPAQNSELKVRSSRVNHSLAAAAMLPAIFVLVPSGLSVQGSLLQGTENADQIVHNSTEAGGTGGLSSAVSNDTALNVGINVVQVAIGITVGLFIGTLLIYPFGKGGKWGSSKKTRSGLFTL